MLGPLLAMLCYDLPWSTGALEDIVVIKAEEGTINNASHPAGCSMASLQGAFATQHVASNAIAKMLCCSGIYKEEAQACWQPYLTGIFTSGKDHRGRNFVDGFPDCGSGGSVARGYPECRDQRICPAHYRDIPSILPDTCGHGMYRGGVGLEFAYTPFGTPEPLTSFTISSGISVPSGRGIFGGYPSSINANVVLRGSDIFELFKGGTIPAGMKNLQASTREILQAKAVTRFLPGDVHVSIATGGGGHGDPIKRDPELVCRDITNGLITGDVAARVYGVALMSGRAAVDEDETERLRKSILAERETRGEIPGQGIAFCGCGAERRGGNGSA